MCLVFFCVFFFFKQKTAYEMRISDWSSDVCSSDLRGHPGQSLHSIGWRRILALEWRLERPIGTRFLGSADARRHRVHPDAPRRGLERKRLRHVDDAALSRSEEHTSELQSLMRISYAVICLKKKN